MSFLLDTNILSHHLRSASGLTHRFVQHSGRLYTSSVSLGEFYDWAFRRPDPSPILSAVSHLLYYEVGLVAFDADCAEQFGKLRVDLRRRGLTVDNMDLMIAATALVFDLTLVTHNTSDFQNIPDLRLDDWLTP